MIYYSSKITPTGSQRGTYLKLQPMFSDIVDHYISVKRDEGILASSSIINSANRGTLFLYYLQQQNHFTLEDVTEYEVIRFFIKDGKPFRETSYRYRLSDFLKTVSDRYPECSLLETWLPLIRKSHKNIQYLADEEISAIKNALLSESSGLSYCDRAIGMTLLYTGLRRCDIASLKLENIDWDKELITLDQSKTGIGVVIPLHVYIGNAIYDFLKHERNSSSSFLFVTSSGMPFNSAKVYACANRIFKAADVRQNKGDHRGTHLFRHHLVTELLENEVPRPVITRAVGHSNPASDEAYFGSDIEHLRRCTISIEEYPLNWEVFDNA